MALSKEQQKELAGLARAANRRLERATPGQRSYLESNIAKYPVRRRDTGMRVFQQGKAKSAAEYRARMRELQKFMEAPTSKRKGWEEIKKTQIENAGKTLRDKQGYDITDQELKTVLEEMSAAKSPRKLYDMLANVEIAKSKSGDWAGTRQEIKQAMNERRTAQERTTQLLAARGRISNNAGDFLPLS